MGALRLLAQETLARGQQLLKDPRGSSDRPSARGPGGASAPAFKWKPGEPCTADAVNAAAGMFDTIVKEFRGAVLKTMLPPEVENLHRVLHTLTVQKSSLLNSESPTGCETYFAGVGQLETDLGHYKGLLAKSKKRRRGKKNKQKEGRQNSLP